MAVIELKSALYANRGIHLDYHWHSQVGIVVEVVERNQNAAVGIIIAPQKAIIAHSEVFKCCGVHEGSHEVVGDDSFVQLNPLDQRVGRVC